MKANFRTVAFDETEFWSDLPEGCTKVFGLYLFCEGEVTHCCEWTPSSWCEFLENVFIGLDGEHPFVEEHMYDDGGDAGHYFHLLDPVKLGDRVSEAREFETAEFEDEGVARDDLWEQASEDVRANALEPKCLFAAMAA